MFGRKVEEQSKLNTIGALLKRVADFPNTSMMRGAFLEYIRSATPHIPVFESALILASDFAKARAALGTTIGPEENFDQEVFLQLKSWKNLLKGDSLDSPNKAIARGDEVLLCALRAVAIVHVLPVAPETIEILIRFARIGSGSHNGTTVYPRMAYYVAEAAAAKRATGPGLSLSELSAWADHILGMSYSLDAAEFNALRRIEQDIAGRASAGLK